MIAKEFIKALLIRKLQEPTTWAGIITFAAGVLHFTMPKDVQDAIVSVAMSIVALCFVAANESRKPSGGPLGIAPPSKAAGDPPAGSVERVPDSPADVVRTVEANAAGVESVSGHDLHNVARPDLPPGTPRPVRPGFDRE